MDNSLKPELFILSGVDKRFRAVKGIIHGTREILADADRRSATGYKSEQRGFRNICKEVGVIHSSEEAG